MLDKPAMTAELQFKAVRSSGSGGQHVNKTASKVELQFDVAQSRVLTDEQKERLLKTLNTRLTKDNVLILQCGESRSQHKNKQLVIERFFNIITEGLKVKKKRKPTKVPKRVKIKRLKNKRKQAEKKQNRKPPEV